MLALLDRDGTINEDLPHGVTSIAEFRILPGVPEAIARLTQAGWRVAVVTNQALVADGRLSLAGLEGIHAHLSHIIEAAGGKIDRYYVCTDGRDRPSARRKPAPGMLLEALRDFKAEAAKTPMIGDDVRDMEAAFSSGCNRILVKTGKGAGHVAAGLPQRLQPVTVYDTLADAVTKLLG